jgi:hypothetical protein
MRGARRQVWQTGLVHIGVLAATPAAAIYSTTQQLLVARITRPLAPADVLPSADADASMTGESAAQPRLHPLAERRPGAADIIIAAELYEHNDGLTGF